MLEVGRTVYADRLGKKVITGEHPLSYHVKTVTRGGETRVLFDTRVPRPPERRNCWYNEISPFQIKEETLPEDLPGTGTIASRKGDMTTRSSWRRLYVGVIGAVVTSLPITAVYGRRLF